MRAHTMMAAAFLVGAGCGVSPGDGEVVTDTEQALSAVSAVATVSPAAVAVTVAAPVVVGTGSTASCTEAALTAALAAGGVVTFNCGGAATITLTSPKTIANTVTVDGGGTITLNGNHQTRIFSVAGTGALTLQRIVLDKALISDDSGAAISSHGSLKLSQVTISNSIGNGVNGGAIYTDGPSTRIDGSVFNNNTALNAGAIFVAHSPSPVVEILNSTFTNNTAQDPSKATGWGGAIVVGNGPHVYIADTVFLSNRALSGGAIYTFPSAVLNVAGSPTTPPVPTAMQFNDNSVVNDGGAIYNQGRLSVKNAEFSTNQTEQDTKFDGFGGAIFSVGTLSVIGSDLYGNSARFGGGLFAGTLGTSVSSATIDATLFRFNTSTYLGGGLYTSGSATSAPNVNITRSSFYYNVSNAAGGGLARFDSPLHVDSSSFVGNSATDGGGLYVWADSTNPYVLLQSVTVGNNTARQGGGIYNNGAGLEMYSMTIFGNTGGVATDNLGNSRFRDTVLENAGSANCTLFSGSYSDDAANFATDSTCQLVGAQSQQSTTLDPLLGPLTQDPAGLTWFFKPLHGSLLIDRGVSCPALDQIGASRSGACDIGAVEGGNRFRVFPSDPSVTLAQ